jgi:hypothetical protein
LLEQAARNHENARQALSSRSELIWTQRCAGDYVCNDGDELPQPEQTEGALKPAFNHECAQKDLLAFSLIEYFGVRGGSSASRVVTASNQLSDARALCAEGNVAQGLAQYMLVVRLLAADDTRDTEEVHAGAASSAGGSTITTNVPTHHWDIGRQHP